MSSAQASRGDIWDVTLDPTVGREESGTRPALVLSIDKFNQGPAELVVVLPITSKNKQQPLHVAVRPPEGGLSMLSFIKCDDIRSVSTLRLKRFCGTVSSQTLADVEKRIKILLKL